MKDDQLLALIGAIFAHGVVTSDAFNFSQKASAYVPENMIKAAKNVLKAAKDSAATE